MNIGLERERAAALVVFDTIVELPGIAQRREESRSQNHFHFSVNGVYRGRNDQPGIREAGAVPFAAGAPSAARPFEISAESTRRIIANRFSNGQTLSDSIFHEWAAHRRDSDAEALPEGP